MPEWVPLENKGEEAIIQGMADVVFPGGNAEFHILDMRATRSTRRNRLVVHPGRWFYSPWRSQEFGLRWSRERLYASGCSLLRNGLNRVVPEWVNRPQRPLRGTIDRLRRARVDAGREEESEVLSLARCEYVLAGHDGALNEYDCHVLEAMKGMGLPFGIFGSTMKPSNKNRAVTDLFRRTLRHADFIYCRDEVATAWARRHLVGLDVQLAPDPAFGMKPAPCGRVKEILDQENLASLFKRPVVMMTPAEPAPIARHAFNTERSPSAKRNSHRELLAALLRHVASRRDANVLFLPHAIGPGRELDDRVIGEDVIRRSGLPPERAAVLRTEYGARELKGLIGLAHVLVAERIHSIIGAVGVHTPFLCLGSSRDIRVSSIVGTMLRSSDVTYLLDRPSPAELVERFDDVWSRRESIAERLRQLSATLEERLDEVGGVIRSAIARGAGATE